MHWCLVLPRRYIACNAWTIFVPSCCDRKHDWCRFPAVADCCEHISCWSNLVCNNPADVSCIHADIVSIWRHVCLHRSVAVQPSFVLDYLSVCTLWPTSLESMKTSAVTSFDCISFMRVFMLDRCTLLASFSCWSDVIIRGWLAIVFRYVISV